MKCPATGSLMLRFPAHFLSVDIQKVTSPVGEEATAGMTTLGCRRARCVEQFNQKSTREVPLAHNAFIIITQSGSVFRLTNLRSSPGLWIRFYFLAQAACFSLSASRPVLMIKRIPAISNSSRTNAMSGCSAGSFSFSVLSGKVMFRDVYYINQDMSIR